MWGIRKFFTLIGLRIVFIKPANMSIPVSVLDPAYDVYFIPVYKYPGRTPSSVGRNFRSDTPGVFLGVEDIDVRNGLFVRIPSGERAKHPHLVVVSHGLKVMHFQG